MTANSIELLPCQVAPLGLHSAAGGGGGSGDVGAAAATVGGSARMAPVSSARPFVNDMTESKSRLKRNLFGTSTKDDISKIFKSENEINIRRLKDRYNVDVNAKDDKCIINGSETKNHINTDEIITNTNQTPLPSLIEKELLDAQQKGKCNRITEGEEAENLNTTQHIRRSHNNGEYLVKVGATQIKRNVTLSSASSTLLSAESSTDNKSTNSASDRSKPYTRQTRLTDCYNIRKIVKPTTRQHDAAVLGERTPNREYDEVLQQLPKSAVAAVTGTAAAAVAAVAVISPNIGTNNKNYNNNNNDNNKNKNNNINNNNNKIKKSHSIAISSTHMSTTIITETPSTSLSPSTSPIGVNMGVECCTGQPGRMQT